MIDRINRIYPKLLSIKNIQDFRTNRIITKFLSFNNSERNYWKDRFKKN